MTNTDPTTTAREILDDAYALMRETPDSDAHGNQRIGALIALSQAVALASIAESLATMARIIEAEDIVTRGLTVGDETTPDTTR